MRYISHLAAEIMLTNTINSPIIVIGMHRSGTTLVAEALNKSGIFMGVFREHNGEALHFLSLNQQILAAAGADWINPSTPKNDQDLPFTANQLYAEHIKAVSQNPWRLRACHAMRWGWKDPRNTFTLPVWLKLFPNAKVLHVVRDGMAVAQSLKARNSISGEVHDARLDELAFNFRLWEKYVAQGISYRDLLHNNYHQIKYEALVENDNSELITLNRFLGVDLRVHLHIKQKSHHAAPPALQALASNSAVYNKLGYGA